MGRLRSAPTGQHSDFAASPGWSQEKVVTPSHASPWASLPTGRQYYRQSAGSRPSTAQLVEWDTKHGGALARSDSSIRCYGIMGLLAVFRGAGAADDFH